MKDKTYHAYLDSHERQLVIHSLVPTFLRKSRQRSKMLMGRKSRSLIRRYPILSVRWKLPQRARVFLPMTKAVRLPQLMSSSERRWQSLARNNAPKIELTAYDDLFQTDESRAEAKLSTQQPEIKTVEDFLDSIENQQLYQILIKVDKLTLQIALLKIQGYSTREIAHSLSITEKAVYRRMDRLKEKIKKFFE